MSELRYHYVDLPPFEQDVWRDAECEFGVDGQEWTAADIEVPSDFLARAVRKIDAIEEIEPGVYRVVESRWVC